MTVDPTPPSEQLEPGATEAVRGGTKTKFNMVALVGGLVLVIAAFVFIFMFGADDRAATEPEKGQTPADAAVFDTTIQPAKGDSPENGDATDARNTRKDGPADPTPAPAAAN